MKDWAFISRRMHADRSYILGIKSKQRFPGGMYLSVDQPSRSLRSTNINGEEMILIGGEGHKTGQSQDTMEHYKALEAFGQQVFEPDEVVYRWSAQDLVTLDKIPYIGELTLGQSNILVATGYRKWGMTNGTAAALLFRDIIHREKESFSKLVYTITILRKPEPEKFL